MGDVGGEVHWFIALVFIIVQILIFEVSIA